MSSRPVKGLPLAHQTQPASRRASPTIGFVRASTRRMIAGSIAGVLERTRGTLHQWHSLRRTLKFTLSETDVQTSGVSLHPERQRNGERDKGSGPTAPIEIDLPPRSSTAFLVIARPNPPSSDPYLTNSQEGGFLNHGKVVRTQIVLSHGIGLPESG